MGRKPRYDRDAIISAALDLVVEGGARAATVKAIAERVGAPTGSLYHRFRSRELLLAELWLGVVEGFQAAVLAVIEDVGDPVEAGVAVATNFPRWVREHRLEASLLLLHHRHDFVGDEWPGELVERARALEPALDRGLRRLCERLYGTTETAALRRVRFAVMDIPYGSVHAYVRKGHHPPAELDGLIEEASRAVLAGRQ